MILTLQTNSFGSYGGIPGYNRLVCRVLNAINWDGGNRVLIAMDDPGAVERQALTHPNLHMSAFGGKRLAFVKAALSTVARKSIDLVLAGHVNYAPLCLLFKLFQPRIRIGVFIYGWEVWERMPALRRWALQRADFVISISEYTKQQAIKINGLSEDRIFLLPNALEWTNEVSRSPANQALRLGTTLLSVGRVDSNEQRKGFDTVIESLPAVAQYVPDVQYVVVGSGSDLERHKQLASTVGVADRVHFLGSVKEEILLDCYKSCDVFVMPSAQEGFGFVYLEAMQNSKPIVAANSCGAPEVVQNGITGKLVEYGNKEELAQVLISLCLNPGERQRLGQAGHESLQKTFTFAQFKQTLTKILVKELPARVIGDFYQRSSDAPTDV